MEHFEKIELEIKKFAVQCKKENIDVNIKDFTNCIYFKNDDIEILFGLTYLEHSNCYCLSMDYFKEKCTEWNQFTNLFEMMNRIGNFISVVTKKTIQL